MGVEIMVPLGAFAMVVGIVWLVSYFNGKRRQVEHETIRHAINQGQALSPDMLASITRQINPAIKDLRRGVLLLTISVAIGFFSYMMWLEEGEALYPMLGIASFPALLGVAYLGLWVAGRGKQD
jgi:Domain of unknown function (DUF6249)